MFSTPRVNVCLMASNYGHWRRRGCALGLTTDEGHHPEANVSLEIECIASDLVLSQEVEKVGGQSLCGQLHFLSNRPECVPFISATCVHPSAHNGA